MKTLRESLDGFVDHAHPISQHHFQFDSLLPLYGTAHQLRHGAVRRPIRRARCSIPGARRTSSTTSTSSTPRFFVTSAAVNPTLTTVANAMRVGDHLIERLGAKTRGD